jgi:hypothetical protein
LAFIVIRPHPPNFLIQIINAAMQTIACAPVRKVLFNATDIRID